MHLKQLEDPLPGLLQLQVQFLELIFVKRELVPAGFERRWAAEPVVGVFDIEKIHGFALPCTVYIHSNLGKPGGRG